MSGWQQLWFGYAVSGMEGRDREQVVACTPGILDDPAVEQQLRRLCRYDADEADVTRRLGAAQSFGWIDDGDLRFIFCRTPVPSSDKTTSTVAAHLLVGSRTAASAQEILALFDSPSWWRGELLDPSVRNAGAELIEISLAELEQPLPPGGAQQRVDEDVLAGLAEAILAGAGAKPVILHSHPHQAVATMAALARAVPALADIVSFSSHELGPAQQWFDVVASAGARRSDVAVPASVHQQRRARLPAAERLDEADRMVSAVLPFVVGRHGELDRSRRDLFFRAIDALVRGNEAGIAWLLHDPRSLLLLVSSRTGRAVAAESLWHTTRPRWVRGNQALGGWTEELRELGASTWRVRPPHAGADDITDAWTELAALGTAAADGFVRAYLSDVLAAEPVGVDPPGRLVASGLRAALDARLGPDVLTRLVDLAAQHVDPDLLTSPVVPVGWRVRLAISALSAGTLSRPVLGAASARDRQLAQHLLGEHLDDDTVGAILGAVPPDQAAALVAASIHTLGSARALRSLREVGRALGAARALSVLDALRSVVDLQLDAEDEQWVVGNLARAVIAGAHDPRRPDPVADLPWDLVKGLTTPDAAAWRQASFLVRPRGGEGRATLVEQFELLLSQLGDERQRHAIATVALDKCLQTAHTADHVAEITDLLGTRQGLDSSELISLLLTRAERMTAVPGRSVGAILVHLGRSSLSRPWLQRRRSLPDGHQQRAEALAGRLTEYQWRDLLRHAEGHGPACAQWLRSLSSVHAS